MKFNPATYAGSIPSSPVTPQPAKVEVPASPQVQQLPKVEVTGKKQRSDLEIALSRPDPLMSVDWDVTLRLQGLNFDLSEYIEDVMIPSVKVDSKQIFRQGIFINVPKSESTGTLTLKLYEVSDLTAYRFFRYWKNMIRDPQGNYSPGNKHKGKLRLIPLAPDKSATCVLEARGVFPISLPSYSFGSGSSDRIVSEVELSCDEIVPLEET